MGTQNSDCIISGNDEWSTCVSLLENGTCGMYGLYKKNSAKLAERDRTGVLEMIGVYTLHVDHEMYIHCSSNLGNWFSFT